MCERHYPRDCLVLRVSRLRVLPVYVYYSFFVYTCLQSTSPYALPTPLRITSPHESLRVARRLSVTSYELPRCTTVHYYVRGLHETTRERVIEDLRQRPEKERLDLTAVRRLAMAQGNTDLAQVAAVAKAASTQTKTGPRTPTLYETEPPMRDRNVPHLPGFERLGMLSDFREDHPDYAYEFATGLESILFLGTPGTSTARTPTKTNSREIATSISVDVNEAPVNLDTIRTTELTDDQMQKAISVISNDYLAIELQDVL